MQYNTDFTTITSEVYDKINKVVEELDCMPVMICRLTNHPEDECLYVVIAKYIKNHPAYENEYCVWEAAVRGETASLFYGHYGISFKTAIEITNDKIRDLNNERV